jgi:hypothetical protein
MVDRLWLLASMARERGIEPDQRFSQSQAGKPYRLGEYVSGLINWAELSVPVGKEHTLGPTLLV